MSTPEPMYTELDGESQEYLQSCIAMFIHTIEENNLVPDDGEDTPELCDKLVRWWHAQPEDARIESEVAIAMIGAAMGEFLCAFTKLDWRIAEDEEGFSLCLYCEHQGNNLVISPFDAVAKRFGEMPEGFVIDFINGLEQIPDFESLLLSPDESDGELAEDDPSNEGGNR